MQGINETSAASNHYQNKCDIKKSVFSRQSEICSKVDLSSSVHFPTMESVDDMMDLYMNLHKNNDKSRVNNQTKRPLVVYGETLRSIFDSRDVTEDSMKQEISQPLPDNNNKSVAVCHEEISQVTSDDKQVTSQNQCSQEEICTVGNNSNDAFVVDILIREDMLDKFPTTIINLQQSTVRLSADTDSPMNIVCYDCPIQEPISMIISESVCICIVDIRSMISIDTNSNAIQSIKQLLKSLSTIVFKFTKIWLILLPSRDCNELADPIYNTKANELKLKLCQGLSRFPAQVIIKECNFTQGDQISIQYPEISLCQMLHGVIENELQQVDLKTLCRPFIKSLYLYPHCKYLQQFPTINYYTACILLSVLNLRQLLSATTNKQFINQLTVCLSNKSYINDSDFILKVLNMFAELVNVNCVNK